MASYYELMTDRIVFFSNRVDTYAKAKGFDNKSVVEHLHEISLRNGHDAVTAEIDQVVPNELHSSRMPAIRKEDLL
jgi:hypothetical protein